MIDIHCHVLPGIDDGARDMEEALQMCRVAADDGVKTIVATPHLLHDRYSVTRQSIQAALEDLRNAIAAASIDIEILCGAEISLEPNKVARFRVNELVPINGGRFFLLDLPPNCIFSQLGQVVFEVRLQGLIPILAHPERLRVVWKNPDIVEPLLRGGALLQVNATSLTGDAGNEARRCAQKLLRRDYVAAIASDAHDRALRPPILSRALASAEKLVGPEKARELVLHNPARFVSGVQVSS